MPRIVLVHGFLGSPGDWLDVRSHLDPGIDCEVVSLRALDCASIASAAGALANRLAKNPCDALVGYSMGGRIALELTCGHPKLEHRLVLLSTGTGLLDEAQRQSRTRQDDAHAEFLRRHGMREFIQQWYGMPLFAPFRAHSSFARTQARRMEGDAEFWAACVSGCSPGRSVCRERDLKAMARRVVLAAGERDDYYAALASRAASLSPDLTVEIIPGAGHALPLEAPVECARIIERAVEPALKQN